MTRELQRVRGEVVERDVPVARPVDETWSREAETWHQREVVVVHEHRYPDGMPTEPVAPTGWRWDRLALYLGSLLFAVVIAGLLVAAGVLDVSLPAPPWSR